MLDKNHGFTLLELIIVIVIISISLAVIIPRISSNEKKILKTNGRKIVDFLKFARYQALFNHREIEVKIDLKDKKFIIPDVDKFKLTDNIQLKLSTSSKGNSIYFLPSGGATPFDVYLIKGKSVLKIGFDSVNGTFILKYEHPD